MNPEPRRWAVLAVLASSLIVIAMDATILNVALPRLAADLDPSATGLLWIVDVYGLVLAGLLVAMGALGDRIGRRRLLTAGLILFALASTAAAVSSTPEQLIAARALLGVGGAMIMPSTLSVLRNVFTDARERTIAIGVWSAAASAGFALGPVVGGAVLELASWPWAFAINVPIVAAALAATRAWVPESRNPEARPLDLPSIGLSVAGMVGVVYGIKKGGEHGFDAADALWPMATGLVLLAAFVIRQRRLESPLLDVGLFASRRFSASTVAVLGTFLAFSSVLLLLAQFLQLVEGASPLEAGLRMLPLAIAAGIAGVACAWLVQRLGANVVVGGGFVMLASALALLTTLEPGAPYGWTALALALAGTGGSLTATAGSAAIMGAAPPERAGGAAAIQETAFELGGALGVAVLGSVMAASYRAELPDSLVGAVGDGLPAAAEAGGAVLATAQAAWMDGLATTMWVGAGLMALIAVISVLLLPGRREQAAGQA